MILTNIKEVSHLYILDRVNAILEFAISIEIDDYTIEVLQDIKRKIEDIEDEIYFNEGGKRNA